MTGNDTGITCRASKNDAYSRRDFDPCGKKEVVAFVKLYGVSLGKTCDSRGTPMCQECLERTRQVWPQITVDYV